MLKFLGVTAFFIALTLVLTYPLSAHLAGYMRDVGDSYEYAWVLGFGAYQLLHDPLNLYSGNIFYPFSLSLAYSDSTIPNILLGAPIIWLTNNPILAHNILLLLTFALGGIGMYLLISERTGSTWAAIVAGVIYGFSPYRFDHLAQIPNVSMEWAPFALWCFERYFREHRQRWAAGFAVFSVLQVLVSFYYAFILGIGIAIYVVARLLGRDRSWLSWQWLAPLLGYSAAGAIVATPFVLPYFAVERAFDMHRTLDEAIAFSAWPANYLADTDSMRVSLISPLVRLILQIRPQMQIGASERHLYPGLMVVLLAFVALGARRARTIAPVIMVVAGVILSFGPLFHPGSGAPLKLPFSMPYTILFEYLPGFTALRVPSRFAGLVLFGLAILAGDGLAMVLGFLRKRPTWFGRIPSAVTIAVACLAVALLESVPRLPIAPIRVGNAVPPVYNWLAKQPIPSPVVELPFDDNAFRESPRSYYSTYDHQPLVNGFRSFTPPAYHSLVADFATFPSPRAVSTMAWLGVRYVVVHQAELTPEQKLRIGMLPIDLPVAARFGDDVVYQVLPVPTPEKLSLIVLQSGTTSRPGDVTTLQATIQRADNGQTIVLGEGTRELSFRLHWEGVNKATYDEIIRVPVSASALVSPQSIDLPAHLPGQAGRYALTVTLIDQPNVIAQFTIPSINVNSAATSAAGAPTTLAPGIATSVLLQAVLPSTRLASPTSVPYLLNWQIVGKPARPLVVFVNAYDEKNHYWSFPRGTETRFSPAQSNAGEIIAEADSLPLKSDTPPGHYWVEAGLLDPATNQRVPFLAPNGDQVTRVVVGSFWLLPPNVIPSGGNPNLAPDARVFGDQIVLESARVVGSPTPGSKLRVDLRWSVKAVPKADYTAFVHVVDASGKLVAQDDAQPTGGVYPTSAWLVGDAVVESMTVQLPATLPPGPYQVQVGLYDLKTMQRLPVTDARGAARGDFATIGR